MWLRAVRAAEPGQDRGIGIAGKSPPNLVPAPDRGLPVLPAETRFALPPKSEKGFKSQSASRNSKSPTYFSVFQTPCVQRDRAIREHRLYLGLARLIKEQYSHGSCLPWALGLTSPSFSPIPNSPTRSLRQTQRTPLRPNLSPLVLLRILT